MLSFFCAEDDDNDHIARKAFEALLRVSLLQPTSPRFNQFAANVRDIAEKEYGYTFFEGEEVNFFIGAFYDGVLLLGMVLNETLAENGDITDGADITRRMWGGYGSFLWSNFWFNLNFLGGIEPFKELRGLWGLTTMEIVMLIIRCLI